MIDAEDVQRYTDAIMTMIKEDQDTGQERDGHCYLIGDASDEAVLREAGIDRAQGLICAVDPGAENVFITIVARSLSPALLTRPGPPGSSRPTG